MIVPGNRIDGFGPEDESNIVFETIVEIKIEQVSQEFGFLSLRCKFQIFLKIERTDFHTDSPVAVPHRSTDKTCLSEHKREVAIRAPQLGQLGNIHAMGNEFFDLEIYSWEKFLQENMQPHLIPHTMTENTREGQQLEFGDELIFFNGFGAPDK